MLSTVATIVVLTVSIPLLLYIAVAAIYLIAENRR